MKLPSVSTLTVASAKTCPKCGEHTERRRTPWLLRPVRWVGGGIRYRKCRKCGWRGFSTNNGVATAFALWVGLHEEAEDGWEASRDGLEPQEDGLVPRLGVRVRSRSS